MRILLITPTVNPHHEILGFLHDWAKELVKYVDHMDIICLHGYADDLGKNVKIISLEKFPRVLKLFALAYYIFKRAPRNNIIYVQMYSFMGIIAGILGRMFNKKVAMWYTHKELDSIGKIMHMCVDKVMTASYYTFKLNSPKKVVLGHGIKINPCKRRKKNKEFTILSVGRISGIKRYEEIIGAINVLAKKYPIKYYIVGPIYDEKYYNFLVDIVSKNNLNDVVTFVGGVPHEKIYEYYCKADLFVSASRSGLDKVALESMSTGTFTLVCDKAYLEYFDKELREKCYYSCGNINELVNKIEYFIKNKNKEEKLREHLINHVRKYHSIETHARKVAKELYDLLK